MIKPPADHSISSALVDQSHINVLNRQLQISKKNPFQKSKAYYRSNPSNSLVVIFLGKIRNSCIQCNSKEFDNYKPLTQADSPLLTFSNLTEESALKILKISISNENQSYEDEYPKLVTFTDVTQFEDKIPIQKFEPAKKTVTTLTTHQINQISFLKITCPNLLDELKFLSLINLKPQKILMDPVQLRKQPFQQKTILLDLEQILIFSANNLDKKEKWNELITNGCEVSTTSYLGYQFIQRPLLKEFLLKISYDYEIIIFTTMNEILAKDILSVIDPHKKYFSNLICRHPIISTNQKAYIKDLRLLQDRFIEDIIVIDYSLIPCAYNLNNLLPISPYTGSLGDSELQKLSVFLYEIKAVEDIRQVFKHKYSIAKIYKMYKMNPELIE